MRKSQLLASALVAFSVVVVGFWFDSAAQATPWSNPSGANARFAWTGGENIGAVENPNGHHGDPAVDVLGFHFLNTVDYRAEVGGVTSVQDTTRVMVDVAGAVGGPAPNIDSITIREWGTWSVGITDPAFYSVEVNFDLFRYSPSPPGSTLGIDLPPVTFLPDGRWYTDLTYTQGPWARVQITVHNSIQVAGGAPAGSFIEKTGMEIIVPEPATAILLAPLGMVVARRFRRH